LEQVEDLEVIGGASKTTQVQEVLNKVFKNPQCTFNPQQAVAIGLAYRAAALSPVYKSKVLHVMDFFPHSISYLISPLHTYLTFCPQVAFEAHRHFPVVKKFKLEVSESFEVDFFNLEEENLGIDPGVAKFTVQLPKNSRSVVEFGVKLDRNGLINILYAQQVQKISSEGEIESFETLDSKPEVFHEFLEEKENYPGDLSPCTKIVPLEVSISTKGMDFHQLDQYMHEERRMYGEEKLFRESLDKKAQIYSFMNEWGPRLQTELLDFCIPDYTSQILSEFQQTKTWLDSDSECSGTEYVQKLSELKELVRPVKKRFEKYSMLPSLVQELQDTIKWAEGCLESVTEDRLVNTVEEAKAFLQETFELLSSYPKYSDFPVSTDDFVKQNLKIIDVAETTIKKHNVNITD